MEELEGSSKLRLPLLTWRAAVPRSRAFQNWQRFAAPMEPQIPPIFTDFKAVIWGQLYESFRGKNFRVSLIVTYSIPLICVICG
jgi:hypothetical protein